MRYQRNRITVLFTTLVTLGWTGFAHAQGCALCYNTASAAKASAIQALRHGILILLIPPLAMFIGIFALAFCRRDRFNDASLNQESPGSSVERGSLASRYTNMVPKPEESRAAPIA